MKLTFCHYLTVRRKRHFDTNVVCKASKKKGIEIFNILKLKATKIIQQLHIDLKQQYYDNRARRDEYLLSKANLESYVVDEGKVNAI